MKEMSSREVSLRMNEGSKMKRDAENERRRKVAEIDELKNE